MNVDTVQFHDLRVRDCLWNLIIDSITWLRWLQEILWNLCRQLILLSILADSFKVFALMLCVEVHVRLWVIGMDPNLAQDSSVNGAHELLSQDVQTVGHVPSDDKIVVLESPLTELVVVIVVVVERLAQ